MSIPRLYRLAAMDLVSKLMYIMHMYAVCSNCVYNYYACKYHLISLLVYHGLCLHLVAARHPRHSFPVASLSLHLSSKL